MYTSNWRIKTFIIWLRAQKTRGKLLATLQGHAGPVYSAQFSPDGKRTVTASQDHTARLWETESGKLLATLQGHEDYVHSAV
jgi:WD40 repeat protein